MKLNQQKNEHLINRLTHQRKAVADARKEPDKGFRWTRRTIALVSILAIIVGPIMGAIIYPDLPISYGMAESADGWFSIKQSGMVWTTGSGILIGPMHTHLVSAIAGMYFGSSAVSDT
jgi:hypothetical protein